MEQRFKLQWVVKQEQAGRTVREFLQEKKVSRTSLVAIKHGGGEIRLNDVPVTVRERVNEGDVLTVIFPPEKPSTILTPESLHLDIIYEDEAILIVNKPPNMATLPSRDHPSGTLANGLLHYYQETGLSSTPHIVTRLDRNTSGLVLVAKHRHIHHLFNLQQQAGQIEKQYIALAEGVFQHSSGKIEVPISRKENSIIERTVSPEGQYACTIYNVIQQYADFALVRIQLKTGRTHQIRVHLSYIGHPLLGDDLYGGKTEHIDRQALHCETLSFFHPLADKKIRFSASLPGDMEMIIKKAQNG